MIYYYDSSALVKRYYEEPGTEKVLEIWGAEAPQAISTIGYVEILSALYRKKREQSVSTAAFRKTVSLFKREWESSFRIEVAQGILIPAEYLIREGNLRGFDAIHLASALWLKKELGGDVFFFTRPRNCFPPPGMRGWLQWFVFNTQLRAEIFLDRKY